MNKRIKKKRKDMMFAALRAVGATDNELTEAVANERKYRYAYLKTNPIRFAILGPFVSGPIRDIPKYSRWNHAGYAKRNRR